MYEQISNSDTREMEKRASKSLSKVFRALSATQYTGNRKRESLYRASEREYNNAIEYLESRICDSCNRVYGAENCTRVQHNIGKSTIYCENCFDDYRRKRRSQRGKQNSSSGSSRKNSWSNSSRESSSSQSNKRNSRSKSSRRENKGDNGIGVSKAMSILDIDELDAENLTESKLKKHYREKVKSTHPDIGGSEEEFKRVKKAKDALNEYLGES